MIPRLSDLFENANEVYLQQDGAPPHFHVNVRTFLDRTFNQRWIRRRGSATEFPPRSPDVINDIPLANIQMVYRSVRHRCWECTAAEGGYFEHVRT